MASSQRQLLLLTIPHSHFAEKARWALAYYGVPHRERVLMPGFHIPVVKGYLQYMPPEDVRARVPGQSETETPILVIHASDGVTVEKIIQGSQKILKYLSSQYATSEKPDLYESCGTDQAKAVSDLERSFDDTFGIAVRDWTYYDVLIANKWRSIIPWALLGPKNPVGWAQSVFWVFVSPLLGVMIIQYINLTPERGKKALEECRASFREASRLLEKSPYLGGQSFSAADLTFASLAYPVMGITHKEGFTYWPLAERCFTRSAGLLNAELRATKAGQHVLQLFAEKKTGLGKTKA